VEVKMRRVLLSLILAVVLINLVSATVESLPPQKINNSVELKQVGADFSSCNITSVSYPNTSIFINNVEMTKTGNEYNYTLDSDYISAIGDYIVNGFCTNGSEDVVWVYDFPVTLSGKENLESQSYVLVGIFIVIFGVACIMLYISSIMAEAGPKIFFLLASFVFLIGSIATISVVAFDSNLTSSVSTTVSIMLYALGLIFFVVFAYIMIRQIVAAMDLYQLKKGYLSYPDRGY